MGLAAKVDRPMTVEEFLEWDSGDDILYELIDGYPKPKFPPNPEFFGQASPSPPHQDVITNLLVLFQNEFRSRGRRCRARSNLQEPVPRRSNRTRIPDVAVYCGRTARRADLPVLVIEILSPSNTVAEMTERDEDLRSIPSVQEIVFMEQDRAVAVVKRRRGDLWRTDVVEGLDASVMLESIDVELPLAEAYRDVLPKEEGEEEDAA